MNLQFQLSNTGSGKRIYVHITHSFKNQSILLPLPLKITETEWHSGLQRPHNIYLKKNKQIYSKINDIKVLISEYAKIRTDENKVLSKRTLHQIILSACEETKQHYPEHSLLYYVREYISSREGQLTLSTCKRYIVFQNLLKNFEGYILKRLYLADINYNFVKEFMVFGRAESYSDSTLYRTVNFIKTILNFVERKGIRTSVREIEIRHEKKQAKGEVITPTEQEIIKIRDTEVPMSLQNAKDWLLISCYTGQRFSDFMSFNQEQLKVIHHKICLSFVQKKTKKQIFLPLHPVVLNIYQKNGERFPPPMNIKLYNESIKKIAQIACLNDSVKAKKRIGHRAEDVYTEKWKIISSHIGRRSFATNFYGKIPTPLLMEATGHSSEQIFLRYINPFDHNRIISLSNYFDQDYKKLSGPKHKKK